MIKIRVLLAEDHTIVRKGLRSLLDDEADIEVVGEAADGREALDKAQALRPDLVIMDIAMPSLNGLEATRRIKKQLAGIKVLILTMHNDPAYILQILKAGASGYVVKQAAPEELILAVRAVYRGERFLSPSIAGTTIEEYMQQAKAMPTDDSYDLLTPREREVLQLIAEGRSTQEMAGMLYISPRTVESHKANLRSKLNLHSTAELTLYAVRKRLIDPGTS
jgi:two-component system response regulator NreC